jgi:hypothetical protein
VFQFYFGGNLRSWLPEEVVASLRKELMAQGVFQESGNWTLAADVTEENLARMNEVYDFILDRMDEIVKRAAGEPIA